MRNEYFSLSALGLAALFSGCVSDGIRQRPAPPHCQPATEAEISALFDRWNNSLKTGNPAAVSANYIHDSVLLPTLSNKVRYTDAEKRDYFTHFLANRPVGKINERRIKIGCNHAVDAGIYTFTYGTTGKKITGRYSFTYDWDGSKWLISHHHSSILPEQEGSATH